jgi:UPF0755 protein
MEKRNRLVLIAIAILIVTALVIVAVILTRKPSLVRVTIPPGLRKEETAAILAKNLKWTPAEEQAFMGAYSMMGASTSPDYAEGVYFPDTYLIPSDESPATTSARLIANFNEKFAPYAKEALSKNIRWTTVMNLASIIQREAAGPSDAALISGILWNRLAVKMPLDVDSTVEYARGDTPTGWWAPITPSDLTCSS